MEPHPHNTGSGSRILHPLRWSEVSLPDMHPHSSFSMITAFSKASFLRSLQLPWNCKYVNVSDPSVPWRSSLFLWSGREFPLHTVHRLLSVPSHDWHRNVCTSHFLRQSPDLVLVYYPQSVLLFLFYYFVFGHIEFHLCSTIMHRTCCQQFLLYALVYIKLATSNFSCMHWHKNNHEPHIFLKSMAAMTILLFILT